MSIKLTHPKTWLKTLAFSLHDYHERAYSSYKLRELGFFNETPLDSSERNLYLLIQPALKAPDSVVYDIGAANGKTASFFSKLNNIRSVHAFEPVPSSYKALQRVSDRSAKVIAHNVAVGQKSGTQSLYVNSWVNSSSFLPVNKLFTEEVEGVDTIDKRVEVPIVRLDDYVRLKNLPLPHFVKIDVQGYEEKVLSGGSDTLKQTRYCFMEMSFKSLYSDCCLFEDVYDAMRNLGFKLIGVSKPMIGKSGAQLQIDGLFENARYSDFDM